MTFKKFFFVVCMAVVLFSWTPAALADMTVTTVGGYGPYQTGNGGEFTLRPSGFSVYGYVSGKTANVQGLTNTFQTFCLEENEYIYPNATAGVVFNNAAVDGGVGGPHPDPISVGTSYLYAHFATATLSLYDYSAAGRSASALDLQNAIWSLEQEPGYLTDAYENLLVAQFGSVDNAMADAAVGANGVRVLNFYYYDAFGNRTLGQDQLVLVPEPASILGLGTFLFLIGTKLRRRKRA